MILSAHQPAYLPWLGYFDKVMKSDVFVFLDTVQFEKNSFINRNRIKTQQGSIWLTIPVKTKGHTASTLQETEIDNTHKWKEKHLKSIYMNYRKAPRFATCFPKLEVLYDQQETFLADLCFRQLEFWLAELDVERTIVRSTSLPPMGKKSDLVFQLCQHFGADHYISGALGKDYLDERKFREAGIQVEFQDYRHPEYPQLYGEFVQNQCILDFWMNTDRYDLISAGGER